jgi:uncharacterized RDD family membrane protein YckC
MESSPLQATIGKRYLGLIVTDLAGNRISFWRATARHFGKVVSVLTFGIGFLMAAFTAKKQALQDIVAKCLVLRGPRPALVRAPTMRIPGWARSHPRLTICLFLVLLLAWALAMARVGWLSRGG